MVSLALEEVEEEEAGVDIVVVEGEETSKETMPTSVKPTIKDVVAYPWSSKTKVFLHLLDP